MERTLHAAQVALSVLKRTDHVMPVGEGATRFARALGFPEQDLLTEKARQAWLLWKSSLNRDDDWLDLDQPLTVTWNATPVFQGTLPRTAAAIQAGLTNRLDLPACPTARLTVQRDVQR